MRDTKLVANVLVALDDQAMQARASAELQAAKHIRPIFASNSDDLLARLHKERFDALILSERFGALVYQGVISLIRSGDLCAPNLPIVLMAELEEPGLDDLKKRYFVHALKTNTSQSIPSVIDDAISTRPRPAALVIDDNEHYLSLLAEALEPSFFVTTTTFPEQAEELFLKLNPDIVVIDYRMPIRDGGDVTRSLRAVDQERPIVILTSHAQPENHIHLIKAGITRFIDKNTPLHEISAALRDIVLEHAFARASKLASQESSAAALLLRAVRHARTDLEIGRTAHAAERLKGAVIRSDSLIEKGSAEQ
jgi:DNA-binding response OmpR family regulator